MLSLSLGFSSRSVVICLEKTLVEVGGGTVTMAMAIAEAFSDYALQSAGSPSSCEFSEGLELHALSLLKRAKPAITLRPTASFDAYHDFMQNLVTRMGPRHFAAYEDSVFRHYVQFGPPGIDLPTFEHILSQWDKKSKKFVFTDRNDGEEIPCSFNLEWLWYYELTGIKKPALGCMGPAAVDAGRARGPIDLLHKKKRREEDDDIPIDALDIDEDAEQPNDAVEQMDWPQQVIYWKSIAAMNESLRRENENKFKDTSGTVGGIDVQYEGYVNKSLLFDEANKESEAPPTGRASPQPLFSDIHKESEDAPPGELPPPEASAVDKALEAEINEGEKVSPPAKELLTCTETGTQREGTGREITPAVEVPSAGDGETQTCIGGHWDGNKATRECPSTSNKDIN
ncbi:uncharacterized protein A4U43_C05F31140 [Asparagus officinalis]|uniref:Uncharacterized protein n=1 Tax=Asparagus officinalis TaxID=4686 RepID=A0A5P1EVT1_ASPOF|nr:uncharacterized protein A4U43_C05F31140 [Asparagus officinalis]